MLSSVIVTSATSGFEHDRQRCHHMPPMPDHETTDGGLAPILDADVVEELDGAPQSAAPARSPAEETVDAVPVLAEVRTVAVTSPSSLPAVQAAAVAATGFVAGVATVAIVRRHTARKVARRRQRRAIDALPIIGSRSFLVDVHLIAKPGE
jgi:hypothetical protein